MWNSIRNAFRRPGIGYIAFLVLCAASTTCRANDSKLAEIRERGVFCARLIRSMEYSYTLSDSDGWRAKGQFFGDVDRYRVNREDVVGMMLKDQRQPTIRVYAAFDGQRQESYNSGLRRLVRKNGSEESRYGLDTIHTFIYSWVLTQGDAAMRWDVIRNEARWKQRFADATYVGTSVDNDVRLEIVDFPYSVTSSFPVVFRVGFASELGWLPMRIECIHRSTKEKLSLIRVMRHKILEIAGSRLAFPLEVKGEASNAIVGRPASTRNLEVLEDTLKVNQKISNNIFKLEPSIVKEAEEIYDWGFASGPLRSLK